MKDENFDPMQEKNFKIVIDTSQIVWYSNWAYVVSIISLIISVIAIYRSVGNVS
jgi:hypothetical protein